MGNAFLDDILYRMRPYVFSHQHNMTTEVILEDTVSGERYKFVFDNSELGWSPRSTADIATKQAMEKLSKEWPAQ